MSKIFTHKNHLIVNQYNCLCERRWVRCPAINTGQIIGKSHSKSCIPGLAGFICKHGPCNDIILGINCKFFETFKQDHCNQDTAAYVVSNILLYPWPGWLQLSSRPVIKPVDVKICVILIRLSVSLCLVKVCQIFLVLSLLVRSQYGCGEGPDEKGKLHKIATKDEWGRGSAYFKKGVFLDSTLTWI